MARLYLLNGSANACLNHFIANAVVQALALGHLESIEQAREIVRNSFKTETLLPYATAWDTADDRLAQLCPP